MPMGLRRLPVILSPGLTSIAYKMRFTQRVSTILFRAISTRTRPLQMPFVKPTPWIPNTYPPTRRSDHVDIYKSEARGRVTVPDPYRWLEADTEETENWVAAQTAFTRHYLDQNPDRQKLEDLIRSNMNFPKLSAPHLKYDKRWYWQYNSGLQAQSVLYRSKDDTLPGPSGNQGPEGEVFFDFNLLSEDGTASLIDGAFSRCGKYYAYAISYSGSDFCTIYTRLTSSPFAESDGKRPDHKQGRFPEEINFCKFSTITWSPDSKGFFYQRFPEYIPNGDITVKNGEKAGGDRNAMMYYHRIGTPQADDVLVMKDDANPEWMWDMDVSYDGKYLILYVMKDTSRTNQLWLADLQQNEIGPDMKWDKLIDDFHAEYQCIIEPDSKLVLRTNKNAPRYRVVTVDLNDPNREFKELIPEEKDAFLSSIQSVNNRKHLVANYSRNVNDEIHIFAQDGTHVTRLAEDLVGTAYISCRHDQPWMSVTISGFTSPTTIARYEFEKEESKRWSIYYTTPTGALKPGDFDTRQVWYESKDGTKVPMFIVRHKSTKFDGTAPAIQYGYGGFSYAVTPFFNSTILTFLQMYGAVYAVPNIRGGAEFGEEWHHGGMRENKVNCFDDFIAATQYLVNNKYAAPGKVVINGASNGGLLVSACVNRAPEGTFGAAVADVGVHDLLRYSEFTIGKAWAPDYGDPQDPHDFDFIYPISPLHNVPTDKILPPTILLTADHDDRVVPAHTFKLTATLQHQLPHNPHPLLVRIDRKAGHGAGKSTEQRIKEAADKWGFAAQSMGLSMVSS